MTPTAPASDPAAVRGTAEWQTVYLDAQHRVNLRAQTALGLGIEVELDTSVRDPGMQLDLFAAGPDAP